MTSDAKIIGGIIVVTVLLIVGFSLTGQPSADSVPTGTGEVLREDAYFEGTSDAPVTLVEFGDFQCPACRQIFPTVNALVTTYPTQLKIVFREYPLQQHKNARPASRAAEAAGLQGKFWDMHTFLYERQQEWATVSDPISEFIEYAKLIGLDIEQFKTDMQGELVEARITQDVNDGDLLRLPGTPTFFVNGTQLETIDQASLEAAINEALARATTQPTE